MAGTTAPGLTFETDPGAVITVDAYVSDLSAAKFFYFVQDRKINGGFNGVLTNPIQFQGTTP